MLHEAGIPSQGAALLDARGRPAAVAAARRVGAGGDRCGRSALDARLARRSRRDKLGEREQTRQSDLARLVRLAEEFGGTGAEFRAELERRFGDGGEARRGVHLLTYHGAKGLEFEVVLLPRLEEKELPSKQAQTPSEVAEERRLFYVGMTRAKRRLAVTWVGQAEPLPHRARRGDGPARGRASRPTGFEALKAWRLERARADEVPGVRRLPQRDARGDRRRAGRAALAELAVVPGVGPAKLERYGEDVLAVLAEQEVEQEVRVAS